MKRKFSVLSLLSVLVIALGIAVPAYMNRDQPTLIGGPFHTPRPTSTRFNEPINEIVEVVEVEESQAEASDETTNCTYPMYYWKDYFDSWPSQIIIAGKVYTREDIFTIYYAVNPDTATLLIQELYTAFLNILGGASHARIDHLIVDANNWLEANPPGSAVSELNQQIGINLAGQLEDYNYGLYGPPPCNDVPPTPTPSATITPTLLPTETGTAMPPANRLNIPVSGQPTSNNPSSPPGSTPSPTTAPILPTATVPLSTAILPSPTLPLVPPTAAPTSTPRFVSPTATTRPLQVPTATSTPRPSSTNTPPPTSTIIILPPTSTSTPRPTNTSVILPPTSTNTPLPTSTNTPLPPTPLPPTSTDVVPPPPPTDTDTPVPTIEVATDTPEPIPTRNPHFVSPTPEDVPLPTPESGIVDAGSDVQLLSLDWLIEGIQYLLGGE